MTNLTRALLPLVQYNTTFFDAPPSLFGPEFTKKVKHHMDQCKTMRSICPAKPQDNPLWSLYFRLPPTIVGLQWQDRMWWSPNKIRRS